MDDNTVLSTLQDYNFSLTPEQFKAPNEDNVTQFIIEYLEQLGYNTKKLINLYPTTTVNDFDLFAKARQIFPLLHVVNELDKVTKAGEMTFTDITAPTYKKFRIFVRFSLNFLLYYKTKDEQIRAATKDIEAENEQLMELKTRNKLMVEEIVRLAEETGQTQKDMESNETKLQALQEAMNKEYDRKIVQEERIRNLLLKKAQLEQHNKEKLQRKTESQEMVKQLKERIVLSPSEYEHKTKELEEQMSAMSEEINENASLISSKTQSLQLLDNLKVVGEGFGKSLKELESDKEKLKESMKGEQDLQARNKKVLEEFENLVKKQKVLKKRWDELERNPCIALEEKQKAVKEQLEDLIRHKEQLMKNRERVVELKAETRRYKVDSKKHQEKIDGIMKQIQDWVSRNAQQRANVMKNGK